MGWGIDLLENKRTPRSTRARRMAMRSTARSVMTGSGPKGGRTSSRRAVHRWSSTNSPNDTRSPVGMETKRGQDPFAFLRRFGRPATRPKRALQVQPGGRRLHPALAAIRPATLHRLANGLHLGRRLRRIDDFGPPSGPVHRPRRQDRTIGRASRVSSPKLPHRHDSAFAPDRHARRCVPRTDTISKNDRPLAPGTT